MSFFNPCLLPWCGHSWELVHDLGNVGLFRRFVLDHHVDRLRFPSSIRSLWAFPFPVSGKATDSAGRICYSIGQRPSLAGHIEGAGPTERCFPLFGALGLSMALHWPKAPGTSPFSNSSSSFLVGDEDGCEVWVVLDCVYHLIFEVTHEDGIFIPLLGHQLEKPLLVHLASIIVRAPGLHRPPHRLHRSFSPENSDSLGDPGRIWIPGV